MNESVLLAQLKDYYARHKEIPSASAMGLLCSKPMEQIQLWLEQLVTNNFLLPPQEPNGAYRPTPQFLQLALAGNTIPAGIPSHELLVSLENHIDLHTYLVKKPSKTMSVFIKGDSMINAGILDGDLAIVETQAQATHNDIVAAIVDGAITLKRLIKQGGSYILKAENPKYEDILPKEHLEIVGVLVGVARKTK